MYWAFDDMATPRLQTRLVHVTSKVICTNAITRVCAAAMHFETHQHTLAYISHALDFVSLFECKKSIRVGSNDDDITTDSATRRYLGAFQK